MKRKCPDHPKENLHESLNCPDSGQTVYSCIKGKKTWIYYKETGEMKCVGSYDFTSHDYDAINCLPKREGI